jgi:hypothetical protein
MPPRGRIVAGTDAANPGTYVLAFADRKLHEDGEHKTLRINHDSA